MMGEGSCEGGVQVILSYFIAIYLSIDSVGNSGGDLPHGFANFKSQMLALPITFGGGECHG